MANDPRTESFLFVAGGAALVLGFLLFQQQKSASCPPGQVRDPATGLCVPPPGGKPSPCPPLGDVDGDGVITDGDAHLVDLFVAHLQTPTAAQLARADVNRDGVVNEIDSLLIRQFVAGLITTFHGCTLTPTNPPAPFLSHPYADMDEEEEGTFVAAGPCRSCPGTASAASRAY